MSADRLRADVFRVRRGRSTWAVPLLLFLAVLLVAALAFNIANLDTGGEAIPGVPDTGGTTAARVGELAPDPYANAILLGLTALFGVAAIILYRRRARGTRPAKPFSWWELLSSALGLGFLIALLLVWPRVVGQLRALPSATNNTGAGGVGDAAWPVAAGLPLGMFLAASVFVAILVLVYLVRRGSGSFLVDLDADLEPREDRQAAARAVDEAIDELELGGDVRTVIRACFKRFCVLLGRRGITEQEALTPRELEALAVGRLHVSREASEALTSLFEEARYSEHTLGEGDRHRAIDSLAILRAALEA